MPRAEHASRQALRFFPRATLIGYAHPCSPIYKAIKCARKPVTLDAYGMPRANVAGNDNANPTHPNTPALLTVPA